MSIDLLPALELALAAIPSRRQRLEAQIETLYSQLASIDAEETRLTTQVQAIRKQINDSAPLASLAIVVRSAAKASAIASKQAAKKREERRDNKIDKLKKQLGQLTAELETQAAELGCTVKELMAKLGG